MRPLFDPTEEQRRLVRTLSAMGTRQKEIAKMIGIAPKTLREHFREELDKGAIEANAQVAKTLFQMATSGTTPAATIFWLKTRARWSERASATKSLSPAALPAFVVEEGT